MAKFTRDGKFLLQFGTRGTGPGQFALPHNVNVVVDAQGKVYVTDRDNERVEVFDGNGKNQWKTYGGFPHSS